MQQDKASLVLGNSTLLESIIARLSGQFGAVIVVQHPEQGLTVAGDVMLTTDICPNCGPLGGIHAGLIASPDDANIVVACDMPFASPEVARYLLSLLDGHDAVVPMLARGPEPLFSIYRKSVLTQVESNLKAGVLKLRGMLDRVDTLYIPETNLRRLAPELHCFLNVNTPEDYDELITQL